MHVQTDSFIGLDRSRRVGSAATESSFLHLLLCHLYIIQRQKEAHFFRRLHGNDVLVGRPSIDEFVR
jgi:hypothetical protein